MRIPFVLSLGLLLVGIALAFLGAVTIQNPATMSAGGCSTPQCQMDDAAMQGALAAVSTTYGGVLLVAGVLVAGLAGPLAWVTRPRA